MSDLRDFLRAEVLPRLSPADVYDSPEHAFQGRTKLRGGCPFHSSASGSSFTVSADDPELLWWCGGCNAGGDPVTYVHSRRVGRIENPTGADFVEAVRDLAARAGLDLPEAETTGRAARLGARADVLEAVAAFCADALFLPEHAHALDYAASRGLDLEAVRLLGVGYFPSRAAVADALRGRFEDDAVAYARVAGRSRSGGLDGHLVFPWRDDRGRMLTLYGRFAGVPPDGRPKTYALPNPEHDGRTELSSKRSPLYLDRALASGCRVVVAVEGVLDAAVLQARGHSDAVAYVGASFSEAQIETLHRRRVEAVVLMPDPDAGGTNGAVSAVRRLLGGGVEAYVCPPLPDGLDPDEFVRRDGDEAFRAHVDRAEAGGRHVVLAAVEAAAGRDRDPVDLGTALGRRRALQEGARAVRTLPAAHRAEAADAVADRLGVDPETTRAEVDGEEAPAPGNTPKARLSAQAGGGTSLGYVETPPERFDAVLDEAALCGLAGDVVRALRAHTEAADVAVLGHFLTGFGVAVGSGPYVAVGNDRHPPRIFSVYVGPTGRGRKGTALAAARPLWERAAPALLARTRTNIQSGEALIELVRDGTDEEAGDGIDLTDPGVADKRLFLIESEFGNVLAVRRRSGSILTGVLRQAWDTGDLYSTTKRPTKATGAHVGLAAHITPDELKASVAGLDAYNGFLNRLLFLYTERARRIALPEPTPDHVLTPLVARLGRAVDSGRRAGRVYLDGAAREAYATLYEHLDPEGEDGLLAALQVRAAPYLLRTALCYALLDGAPEIRPPHLRAAAALWDYHTATLRHLFGRRTGDATADRIARELAARGEMTRTEINDLFNGRRSAAELNESLGSLRRAGLADVEERATGGRPKEVWRTCGRRGERGGSPTGRRLLSLLPLSPQSATTHIGGDGEAVPVVADWLADADDFQPEP